MDLFIGYVYGTNGAPADKHTGKNFLEGEPAAVRFLYENMTAPEVRITDALDNLLVWVKDGKPVPEGTEIT